MEHLQTEGIQGHESIMKIPCLILARGGSKGLSKKNIFPLNGKPMILYTIEAAMQSKCISNIIVSTDDKEIAEIASSAGAEVIIRPESFSKDDTTSAQSALHVIETSSILSNAKDFILLQCTSPVRSSKHIDEAFTNYLRERSKCLVSVTEAEHHPFKMFFLNEDKVQYVSTINDFELPRQKLKKAYRINGSIYIRNIADFKLTGKFVVDGFLSYIMSSKYSIDVDNLNDALLAELVLKL